MAKRIVQIIDRLNVGGPTKYVTWLSAELSPAEQGRQEPEEFRTLLITGTVPPGEGDMSWFARDAGLTPLIIPEMSRELSPKDILVLCKLIVILFKFKPDIVNTHKAKAGAIGRAAALIYRTLTRRKCRIVHVYHGHIFHSYYGRLKSSIFIAIERLMAIIATDRILTISNQQRREIAEDFHVGNARQHVVIPYGLDFTVTQGPSLREIPALADPAIPLVGLAGRLCEVKNHEMFIEAAAILQQRAVPVKFVIIGDGHLRDQLEAMVRNLNLGQTVVFTGFRDDVMNLYRDLSIAAITSLNEGTPFTLIEAMNFGVPAVATSVGGVVDLMGARLADHSDLPEVSFWENGLTVRSRDSKACADAIQFMLTNEAARNLSGTNARHFIEENFSKQRFLRDIANLYREMLG